MLFYFKKYLENTAPAIVTGSLLGAACGSVAGVVGLYQMCSSYSGVMALDGCTSTEPMIVPGSERAAAVAGALAGSAIGFVAGSVVYPICTGFVNWCRNDMRQREAIQEERDNLNEVVMPRL